MKLKSNKIAPVSHETFMKMAFESSAVPSCIIDSLDYRYIICNPAALSIYGFKSENDIHGKTMLDVSALKQYDGIDSTVKLKYYIDSAFTGGRVDFEWLHQRSDGELWDAEVSLSGIISNGLKFLQITLKDITGRKKADEELRARESYLTAIIENQPGLIWLKDREGRFLVTNSNFSRSCGFDKPENISGKTDYEVWPWELAAGYVADDGRVLKSGKPYSAEELILDKGLIHG